MDVTTFRLEVAHPDRPEVTRSLDFLLDSGIGFSVVPAAVLNVLRIQPLGTHEFRLWDGSSRWRRKGVAIFRYGARAGAADVIFGEKGDCILLGAQTLEALGFELDFFKRTLRDIAP